jgi:hypothetical protein
MQNKPSKWVSGYKHGPAASYTQITRMGLFLNVSTSKFEPLDSTWDNLHSGGMFISDDNKIYFRDETNKDIYINSPADNQLEIYATGGITAPVQPAFEAYATADQTNIATGSWIDVVMDAERFDQGSNFASNTFTAPVTGKYMFTTNLAIKSVDTAATQYGFYILVSNAASSLITFFDPRQFAGDILGIWPVVLSGIVDMDAGDTAKVQIHQTGGTAQADIDGSGSYVKTGFTGFLVC